MNKIEIMQKARQDRKPILIYENKQYKLEKIKLNYRIIIKLPRKSKYKTINRDFYSSLDDGVDSAHEMAEWAIKEYFIYNAKIL